MMERLNSQYFCWEIPKPYHFGFVHKSQGLNLTSWTRRRDPCLFSKLHYLEKDELVLGRKYVMLQPDP